MRSLRRLSAFSVGIFMLALMFSSGGMAAEAQADEVIHVVQPGDNLYRLSLRYDVSIQAIASANNISNINLIFVGQRLVIPDGDMPPTPEPPTPEPPQPPTPEPPPTGEVTYTVVRGDTLSRIAQRFGTTWQILAQLNNIANPNRIFPGQVLRIPTDGTQPPGPPTPQPPQPPTPPPPSGTNFELGGHVFDFAVPDLMRLTGMTWAKRQFRWNGSDGPNVVQGLLDDARNKGFKLLLSVVGEPSQIAANPTQYYQNYANFVGGVAALGVEGIEVWNEPNIDREWPNGRISGGNYTQMLAAAYQAIKRNNPDTLVISGGPTPTGFFGGCQAGGCDDNVFIQQMAAAGAAQFMDCVGIHYNTGLTSPSASSGAPVGSSAHYSWYYPRMVDLYRRTFPTRPLCFTELGYLSGDGYPPLPGGFAWASGTSVNEHAAWLAESVSLARQSGAVRLFIIWNVDAQLYNEDPQAGYAIIRPDGTCPACNTVSQVMR